MKTIISFIFTVLFLSISFQSKAQIKAFSIGINAYPASFKGSFLPCDCEYSSRGALPEKSTVFTNLNLDFLFYGNFGAQLGLQHHTLDYKDDNFTIIDLSQTGASDSTFSVSVTNTYLEIPFSIYWRKGIINEKFHVKATLGISTIPIIRSKAEIRDKTNDELISTEIDKERRTNSNISTQLILGMEYDLSPRLGLSASIFYKQVEAFDRRNYYVGIGGGVFYSIVK